MIDYTQLSNLIGTMTTEVIRKSIWVWVLQILGLIAFAMFIIGIGVLAGIVAGQ